MRCCVFTRFVYEVPYIESFIDHYLQLGFDKIILLYHDISRFDVPEHLIEEVELVEVENNGNKLMNEYKHLFQEDDFDWVLNVDSDEFLILGNEYTSIKEYIAVKLDEEAPEINMFQFSWGWLHAFNPPETYTFPDYVKNYKIFLGSKDTDTKDIWVKSLTKVGDIEYMTCHNCVLRNDISPVIYVNGKVFRRVCKEDLEEDHMKDSDGEDDATDEINLLPRSYALREDTYSESILIHVNTRNMMNAIIKGLNIHVTQVKRKRIKKFKELKKFVNNFDFTQPVYKETLKQFARCIGYKVKFPLLCLEKEEITSKIMHLNLRPTKVKFCRESYIPEQNTFHLNKLQEHMKVLFRVLDMEKFMKILSVFGILFDNTFKQATVV
jgi:hypothetical protein